MRSSMRSSRRPMYGVGAMVAAVLVLGLVSACDTQKAGSAAIAGDERFTQSQVTDQVDEVSALYDSNSDAQRLTNDQLTQAAIAWWLNDRVMAAYAADNNIDVTDAQVDQILGPADQRTQLSLRTGVAPSQLDSAARAVVAYQSAAQALISGGMSQQQAVAELNSQLAITADDIGVKVNPRYGSGWNPGLDQQLKARNPARLSSPAAGTPNPSPEPTLEP
ncbi:MAG: SurA N-terminal domain-containing protein [Actinomycetes bacterium]